MLAAVKALHVADAVIFDHEDLRLLSAEESASDVRNAEAFARFANGMLLYHGTTHAWWHFDGQRWRPGETGVVVEYAKEMLTSFARMATNDIRDDMLRHRLLKHVVKTQAYPKIKAMLALAQSSLPVTERDFDRDDYLLNLRNGTLDLRTQTLRAHRADDLITRLAPIDYDDAAEAPRWMQFLREIFDNRDDLIAYLQRLAGYFVTGDVREHVLPIAYGRGRNGKSVFVRTLQSMMGDYAQQAPASLFLANGRGEHGASPEVARLRGARFAAASELPEDGRLSENLVKQLTGGDRITARPLYGKPFEFEPTTKFLISTNNRPRIGGDDDGIWSRVKMIPFERRFLGDEADKMLNVKLQGELSGILRWAVVGCAQWQKVGLREPSPVVSATLAYRTESDTIAAFLADDCELGDTLSVRSTALNAHYQAWCASSNERALSARKFFTRLRDRSVILSERRSHGERVFTGLAARAD